MHLLAHTRTASAGWSADHQPASPAPVLLRQWCVRVLAVICLFPLSIFNAAHGITYYQIGNSLTYDSYPFNGAFTAVANAHSKNITGNGWHIRSGEQLNYIHANPNDPATLTGPSGNWQTSLAGHYWDIITFQPFYGGTSTLGTDTSAILEWIDLATANASPDAAFYIYAPWPKRNNTLSYSQQWLAATADADNQPTAITREYLNLLLGRVRSLRDAAVDIIPIGEVWFHIEQLIESGAITELSNAYDLYRDEYHANDIGKSVIAWTLYATLFRESAVGIALGDIYSFYGDAPIVMDDVLALKLQHAVDDVVFAPRTDTNSDGIPDEVALQLGLSIDDTNGDTDHDLKPDIVEIGRDVRNPLDTDSDGIIDALEPDPADIDPSTASGLRLANGNLITIATSSGEMLSEVHISGIGNPPNGIEFPFGAISYKTTAPPGGSVSVMLEFSEDLPTNLFVYKIDHDGSFSEFPANLWTQPAARTLRVTLTDADNRTDLDGVANGIIDDPIAIGSTIPIPGPVPTPAPAPNTTTDNTISTSSGGGCTLSTAPNIDLTWLVTTAILLGFTRRIKNASRSSPGRV